MPSNATSRSEDQLWRRRWVLLASCVCIAIAVAVLVSTQPTHWHWPLFGWGVAVGVAGLAILELVAAVTLRSESSPASRNAWKRRRLIYDGIWLFFGAVIGVIAAAFNAVWIDIVLTAYAALSLLAGMIIYRAFRRRQLRSS